MGLPTPGPRPSPGPKPSPEPDPNPSPAPDPTPPAPQPISAKDLLNRGRRFYKTINFGNIDFSSLTKSEYKQFPWRYVRFRTISQGSIGAESLNWDWINYRVLGSWNYKSMRNDAVNLSELSQKTLRVINATPQSSKRFSFNRITRADANTADNGQKITIYQSNSLPRVINSTNTKPSLFSFRATPGSLTFNGFLTGTEVCNYETSQTVAAAISPPVKSRMEQPSSTLAAEQQFACQTALATPCPSREARLLLTE